MGEQNTPPLQDDTATTIFFIAGEHSGDALGAKLMEALKAKYIGKSLTFKGLGGEQMTRQGLTSLFPMEEIAIMGPTGIIANLPSLIRRVYQTLDAVLEANPDLLVIIDSPEFTHPIAKRVRKKAPHIPIVNYVSPTIWAWRPGRAKKMKPYVDEVLALLPFEPAYHEKLGGPSCHYVGHPLIEKKEWLEQLDLETFRAENNINKDLKTLVLLPGSRSNEIRHLMAPYGEALPLLLEKTGPLNLLMPVVNNQKEKIEKAMETWPIKPKLILGEEGKFKSFKLADAALAASGTVTLELALAQTPMVVTYKIDTYLLVLRPLMKATMFALANHVRGVKAFPELLQNECTPENIVRQLSPLLDETSLELKTQKQHLAQILQNLSLEEGTPSQSAAAICLKAMKAFKGN